MRDSRIETTVVYAWMDGVFEAPPPEGLWSMRKKHPVSQLMLLQKQVSSGRLTRKAVLSLPVQELGLDVRSRKMCIRLRIGTIGDLIWYTGDSLVEVKNFGISSLNLIREHLKALDLRLRGD